MARYALPIVVDSLKQQPEVERVGGPSDAQRVPHEQPLQVPQLPGQSSADRSTYNLVFAKSGPGSDAQPKELSQFIKEIQSKVDKWEKAARIQSSTGETEIWPSEADALVRLFAAQGVPEQVPHAKGTTRVYPDSQDHPKYIQNESFVYAAMKQALRQLPPVPINDADLNRAKVTGKHKQFERHGSGSDAYTLAIGNMRVAAEYIPASRHDHGGGDKRDEPGRLIVSALRDGRRVRLAEDAVAKILPALIKGRSTIDTGDLHPLPEELVVTQWHDESYDDDALIGQLEKFERRDPTSGLLTPRQHAEMFYPTAVDAIVARAAAGEVVHIEPDANVLVLGNQLKKSSEQVVMEIRAALSVVQFRKLKSELASRFTVAEVKAVWDQAHALKVDNAIDEELQPLPSAFHAAFQSAMAPSQYGRSADHLDPKDLIALGIAAEIDPGHVKRTVAGVILASVNETLTSIDTIRYPANLLSRLQQYAEIVGLETAGKALRADKRLWKPVQKKIDESRGLEETAKKYGLQSAGSEWQKLQDWLSQLPQ